MQKAWRWFFILILLSIIGSAVTTHAATYTVSTTGDLIAKIQSAQSGDIIELTDGVYPMYPFTNDDAIIIQYIDNLTIRGKSGNRDAVVLQGGGAGDWTTPFIFKLYGATHCTIQDMTLKDVYYHHIQINDGSSYFKLENLVMLDAGEAPVKVTSPGGDGPFSDYGLIENCWLGCTDYCTNYDNPGEVEGIDIIASAGTVIRNNKFYRIRLTPDWNGVDVAWGAFAKCNAQDTIMENNYFEDCDLAMSFGDGGCPADYARYGDITYQHRGGIMRNNVINRTVDNGIHLNSANGFKVFNNTLWTTFGAEGSSIDVRFNSSGEITNNICNEGYRLRDGGTATFAANIWNAAPSLFVDQANGNFHLAPTAAAAIDKGVNKPRDVPYDMDWQKRPVGPAWDIGAYEYNPCSSTYGGCGKINIEQLYTANASDAWNMNFAPGDTINIHDSIIIQGTPGTLYNVQMSYYLTKAGVRTLLGRETYTDYSPGTYYLSFSTSIPSNLSPGRGSVSCLAALSHGSTFVKTASLSSYVNIGTPGNVKSNIGINQIYTGNAAGDWEVNFHVGDSVKINLGVTIQSGSDAVYAVDIRYYFYDAAGAKTLLGRQVYNDYKRGSYYLSFTAPLPAGAASKQGRLQCVAVLNKGGHNLASSSLTGYIIIE